MIDLDVSEYIWKNYTHYIDEEYDYLKILRALLFPINEKDPYKEKVAEYKKLDSSELQSRMTDISVTKREQVADQIYSKHKENIHLNYCKKCSKLAIAPESERCMHCGYTWYGTNPYRK